MLVEAEDLANLFFADDPFTHQATQPRTLCGASTVIPTLEDGHHAITSAIVQIDPSSPPTWARSTKRVYRLGKPTGPAQMTIHKLAESKGVAPWRRADPKELEEYAHLTGHPLESIDRVEHLLLILHRSGYLSREEAVKLHVAYCREIKA
ncbi:hypothetical protein NKY66_10680 [Sinorhizobium meliloti]|uniref:hypothetical protein n=1 Tax=Rhizobium meliloti TaxID=382 RepID=UPI003D6596DC